MSKITRTEDQIDEQLNACADGVDIGSQYPGMSYEEGVQAALLWVTGQSDDPPFEE